MSKNNYFNYVDSDSHYYFLNYLLAFAMKQHKDEDPLLSDCAKEIIRYILKMDESENVIITEKDDYTFTVNHDKCIGINSSTSEYEYAKSNSWYKEYYFVCYTPSGLFNMYKIDGIHLIHLSIKKIKEICSKYQSDNQIFIQFLQFLNEQEHIIKATLQKPMEQWNQTDYRYFTLHLVEDSVVDVSKNAIGHIVGFGSWLENMQHIISLYWYYISEEKLCQMGIDRITIYLYTRLNTINIRFKTVDKKNEHIIQKLEDFVNNICPMPITFDLSNYKEKFKYAQSIIDRLETEFRLSFKNEANNVE